MEVTRSTVGYRRLSEKKPRTSFSTSSGASSGTKCPALTCVNFAFGIIFVILSAYVEGDFPVPQTTRVGTFRRGRPCSISFIGLKLGCVGESGNILGNA